MLRPLLALCRIAGPPGPQIPLVAFEEFAGAALTFRTGAQSGLPLMRGGTAGGLATAVFGCFLGVVEGLVDEFPEGVEVAGGCVAAAETVGALVGVVDDGVLAEVSADESLVELVLIDLAGYQHEFDSGGGVGAAVDAEAGGVIGVVDDADERDWVVGGSRE